MSVSKVIVNGVTKMDATSATAAAADITAPKTAMLANGEMTEGTGSGSGGYSTRDILYGEAPSGEVTLVADADIPTAAICGKTAITRLTIDLSDGYKFARTSGNGFNLLRNQIPAITIVGGSRDSIPSYCVSDASEDFTLTLRGTLGSLDANAFRSNGGLTTFDFTYTGHQYAFGNNNFYGDNKLTTVILRGSAIVPLGNVSAFNTCNPWKSGGTGGTIYIPKALYDHLGDNSSLDYKAATNWSTLNGYGTITWAQIEGSYYETHYADGTTIPSA